MTTPNVAVLVLDSVRRDHCSTYGYQRETTSGLTEIGKEGYVFENAYATGSWTVPSHGSLFTGQLPTVHGAHARKRYFDVEPERTLSGKLSERGYETACFTANPWLTHDFGFDTGFETVSDFTTDVPYPDAGDPRQLEVDAGSISGIVDVIKWITAEKSLQRLRNSVHLKRTDLSSTDAEEIIAGIEQWLGEHDDDPFFLFANFMDAHDPYSVDQRHDEFWHGNDGTIDVDWNLRSLNRSPEESQQRINDAYDSALHYLDTQIGKLVEILDHHDRLEDTLLLVLGDHGQCLGEHGYWGHGTFLYEELLQVPLIVRPPNGCNSVDINKLVSIRDLYDLVLDFTSGTTLPECIGTLPDPGDGRVVAESLGKHQNIGIPSGVYSAEGFRGVVAEGRLGIRKYEEDWTDVGTGDWVSLLEKVEQQALRQGEIGSLNAANDEQIEFGETTKQQLEDLGYM
ncbi:sulfatase [Halosimplex rubrum]|uniref:Sulfatase n=1 Tax=Halosimplex rubrum TaxID=869889 RepID=A0A7D5SWV3_9EURY|nr:sulfatase [Halosimplex rubrum]QLH76871.1 sulfatase [Halosimplex rubrum]